MEDIIISEIQALHQFFQDWFTGSIAETEANFARVTSVLHPHFCLVAPDGQLSDRATVLRWIWKGYGTRPDFQLWAEQTVLRHRTNQLALATYEEWQQTPGSQTVRLSSALFQRRLDAPHGVEWLHVHETWLRPPL